MPSAEKVGDWGGHLQGPAPREAGAGGHQLSTVPKQCQGRRLLLGGPALEQKGMCWGTASPLRRGVSLSATATENQTKQQKPRFPESGQCQAL